MDIIALIVFAEAIVSLVLWLAAFALALAMVGAVESGLAHALAIYVVTGFTGDVPPNVEKCEIGLVRTAVTN